MWFSPDLDNRIMYILHEEWGFFAFSDYSKDVEAVLLDISAIYSWFVNSSFVHAFFSLLLLFTKRKEWVDIYESNTVKCDCMHWETEVHFTILCCYFLLDIIYLPLVRHLITSLASISSSGNLNTHELDKSTVRLRISWTARLKMS